MKTTRCRPRRSRIVHASPDNRKTRCGRSCDGWIVEPDAKA